MSKNHVNAPHLFVINFDRYWLTSRELKAVKKIQQEYPNKWQEKVLKAMSTGNL